MRVTKILLIALFALLASSFAAPAARTGGEPIEATPAATSCPTVTVTCAESAVPGQFLTFAANISGGDPAVTPKFKWVVKGSGIQNGQGESSMNVEPLAERGEVSATVEVAGYDRSCSLTASCTTRVFVDSPPRKIDEYGDLAPDEEKTRLNNFAAELRNDPTAQGYVVCYGGRRTAVGEARRRCARVRDYLGSTREPPRTVMVEGGFREEPAVELWVVPSGVAPPEATPTVDPREVKPPPPPPRKTPPRTPPRPPVKKP